MIPNLAVAYANEPYPSARPYPTCPFCGVTQDVDSDNDGWVSYFGSDFKDGNIVHEWFCFGCWTGWEVEYTPTALVIKEAQ